MKIRITLAGMKTRKRIEKADDAQDQEKGFVAGHQADGAFAVTTVNFDGQIRQGIAPIQQDQGAGGGERKAVGTEMQIAADDFFAEDPQTGIKIWNFGAAEKVGQPA